MHQESGQRVTCSSGTAVNQLIEKTPTQGSEGLEAVFTGCVPIKSLVCISLLYVENEEK